MDPQELYQKTHMLFMRYGIKSQTMDDISRHLTISKKTLYKYCSDKADLVKKTMLFFSDIEKALVNKIASEHENAIDELVEMTKHFSALLREMHPSIHYDLQKYYTEAFEVVNHMKSTFHFDCVKKNLKKGIKQGLYRKNINSEVIARLHIEKVDMVFDPDVFDPSRYKFEEVFTELMRYHIRGIATKEGISYLKEIVKKDKLNLI